MRAPVPIALAVAICLAPSGPGAEPFACPDADITVDGADPDLTRRLCQSAARAVAEMAQCNIHLSEPVAVEINDALDPSYVGLYHCGENRVELLTPEETARRREADSPFAVIPDETYYDSILLHELAHAAHDAAVPCPSFGRPASSEYVAYTMQVRSYSPELIAAFEAYGNADRQISRDELSAMILYMAPHTFASRAWQHFTQRDDGCEFVGQIMSDAVSLDFERP